MKKTRLTDALRNIKKQFVSWLSVAFVAAMAAGAFLGINFTANSMRKNSAEFYRNVNFRDLEMMSTLLLTEEDLTEIAEIPGVRDVEGVYQVPGHVLTADGSKGAGILSLTERINGTQLLTGRYPENENECVLEKDLALLLSLEPGDTLSLADDGGNALKYLKIHEFTVVGTVLHADHIAGTNQVPGDRYLLVRKEAFDSEAIPGACMKAEILIEKPEGMTPLDKSYTRLLSPVKAALLEMTSARENSRDNQLQTEALEKLEEARAKLDQAKRDLEKSRAEIDKGWEEYYKGEDALPDAQKKLLDAAIEIENGEKELQEAAKALEEGRKQLEEAKAEIDRGEAEYAAGKQKLDAAKVELDNGKAELDRNAALLESGRKELTDGFIRAEEIKTKIRQAIRDRVEARLPESFARALHWAAPNGSPDVSDPALSIGEFRLTEGISISYTPSDTTVTARIEGLIREGVTRLLTGSEYEERIDGIVEEIVSSSLYSGIVSSFQTAEEALKKWNDGHAQYVSGLAAFREGEARYKEAGAAYLQGEAELQAGRKKLDDGIAAYEAGLQTYAEKEEEYEAGEKKLEEGRAALEEGQTEYDAGVETLKKSREELEEYERQYADGVAAYEEAKERLTEAEEQYRNMPHCHWVLMGPEENGSCYFLLTNSGNISRLGMTFALLFVLLGALVIYATASRIVDEQRRLIGTVKAIGFYNREVMLKFLIFGISATLTGALVGTAFAYFLVQRILLNANNNFYVIAPLKPHFAWNLFLIVLLSGVLLSVVAVFLACYTLVRKTARELMQDKMPEKRKKEEKSGSGKGSLYTRLILRNITSDLSRVIVTVISVAGSCILLMIGFSLKSGVRETIRTQFEEIQQYDFRVSYDSGKNEKAGAEIEALLKENGVTYGPAMTQHVTNTIKGVMGVSEAIVAEPEVLMDFMNLRDFKSREKIELADSGILVQGSTGKFFKLSPGDSFTVYDSEMDQYPVKVQAVYECYFGREFLLTKESYRRIYGDTPEDNCFLMRGVQDFDALEKQLKEIEGYSGFVSRAGRRQMYERYSSVLSIATLLLVVMAGLMSLFVLLNLVSMYINQKKRELTIMRVNGFSTRETRQYVSREGIVTTVLGIVLGIVAGGYLGDVMLGLLEQQQASYLHRVAPVSVLLSVLIAAGFSAAIYFVALRKVKKLKLSDIA